MKIEDMINKVKDGLKRKGFDELQINIGLSFWKPIRDGHAKDLKYLIPRFEKEYNVTKKRISQRSDRYCFDSCTAIINGVEVHYYSEHYLNPDFDKELCIQSCAESRERHDILERHKNEMDVEGRIRRIKDKKDIGCYNGGG